MLPWQASGFGWRREVGTVKHLRKINLGRLNLIRRMKIRTKMLFLLFTVFIGFMLSLGMGFYTVNQVKIGSSIYTTIKKYKDSIEQIALLKSDLNQARAELLNFIDEKNPDQRQNILATIKKLTDEINGKFPAILKMMDSEEKKVAIQDAQTTWQEFSDTMEKEVIPALQRGDRDQAWEIATTMQKMRYERFIEQVGSTVDTLKLEIDDLEASTAKLIQQKILTAGATSGALFLFVLTSILIIASSITRPLLHSVKFAQSVAAGNLTETVDVTSRDELGHLALALSTMVESLRGMVEKVNSSAAALTEISGNIFDASRNVITAAGEQAGNVEETSHSMQEINASVEDVAKGVSGLAVSASETSSSTLEMAASIEEVALSMETLARSVDEVSSSITEMTAAIKQIAGSVQVLMDASSTTASSISEMDVSIKQVERSASDAATIAKDVLLDAEIGREAVEATIKGMEEIRSSSRITGEVITSLSGKAEAIGNILSVINDVAEQTNLLALNAAIIAAQAGEHGKGFAVVADEIKELAERTKSSTGEIADVIRGVQEETLRAVEVIRKADLSIEEGGILSHKSGAALQKIVSGVQSSTEQVTGIARAAAEQARGSQMINQAMEQVARMIQQIGNATREQEKVSEIILDSAERMKNLTSQVRSSTREQSNTGNAIAQSTEKISVTTKQIDTACAIQKNSSLKVIQAVKGIQNSTNVNLDATKILDDSVSSLSVQVSVLQQEMKWFKVSSADAPVGSA